MIIKCPNCGADNRDTARFCKVCGTKLLLPVAQPQKPTWLQPSMPAPLPMPMPHGLPPGFPKAWKDPQPNVQGKVIHVEAPVQEKGAIGGKIAVAGLLALIAPILAFLPFAQGTQVTVRYLRVEEWQTRQQRSIKMRGEPQGIISIGDWLAVWGKDEGGNVIMRAAYNYTTDADIRLKV